MQQAITDGLLLNHVMRVTTLNFTTIHLLETFLFDNCISRAQVATAQRQLTAPMTEREVSIAIREYQATLVIKPLVFDL